MSSPLFVLGRKADSGSRAEDELAVLECVNYQGTAFLRLYHKMLLLGLLDIFEAFQNRKKLKLLLIASQMF